MRIGLFTNNYRPLQNGLATSVDSFAQAFRRAGHAVTVVAPRYPDGPGEEPGVIRVPGWRAPTHHAYVLPAPWWPGLDRKITGCVFDVFHAQHPFLLGKTAARSARRTGRPLVFTYHTRYAQYAHYVPGPAGLVARLALRRALRFAAQADLVIAPAPSLARDLRARGLTTPIEVVPTGVPLPPAAGPEARHARRQALGLGPGNPLCMSVGRLAPEKNLRFLLAAFARILAEMPEARLVLVGDGDDRPRLEQEAADLGIQASVSFAGGVAQERVHDYNLAADLFLFPSTSETQGLVALEALAAALPVVAVASKAAGDLFGEGTGGLLTPEDPEAFARTVVTLWGQPDRCRALGEAGRRTAARYTPEVSAARLLELYQGLLVASRSRALPARAWRSREVHT